ncbi:MAG: hypothetical protein OXH70_18375 [Acidobacteria bacterium]|nr:hypothetical protein [Acidobacteriota bacterium]
MGWIEEVPGVNCQEGSREDLLETLTVTLSEALESDRQTARAAAGEGWRRSSSPHEALSSPRRRRSQSCD